MRPSRHMLTGEFVLSCFAFAYALNAIMPDSYLHHLLSQREGLRGVCAWLLIMGIPALWLAVIDFWEFVEPTEFCSARLRACLLVYQGAAWLYSLHLMLVLGHAVSLLFLHSGLGAVSCAWFHWENRRVQRERQRATCSAN